MRRQIGMALVLGMIGWSSLAACDHCGRPVKKAAPRPAGNDIWLHDSFYAPLTIRVSPGSTVRWVNQAFHRHTVTSSTGLWDSGPLERGQAFALKFDEPGTFHYFCRFHSGMRGTVIVW
jgi:plastocyanin